MEFYHAAIHQNLKLFVEIYPNLDMELKLQEDMFKKPNAKGMHSVFYSLMMILNPEYCQQKVPWPVSFQSDHYKFRMSVINFIKTECPGFEPPQLLPSLLNKADGEKYVKLVFDFVSYVTKVILERQVPALNMPSVTIDGAEGYRIFAYATASVDKRVSSERESSIKQQREMLEIMKHSDDKRKEVQRSIRYKKEQLSSELIHLLSYTNVNEKNMVDQAILNYRDELQELQRTYSHTQHYTCRILKKKEHLLRLIFLLQNSDSNLINSENLRSIMKDDITMKLNAPLSILTSSLFVNSGNGNLIDLKKFVQYGYLLLRSRQRKILESKIPDQHHTVYLEANHILRSLTQKLNELKCFDETLDKSISESKQKIPNLRRRVTGSSPMNDGSVETMRSLTSSWKYCPQYPVQLPEKALLFEIPKPPESDENKVARLKRLMKRNATK